MIERKGSTGRYGKPVENKQQTPYTLETGRLKCTLKAIKSFSYIVEQQWGYAESILA